MSNGQDMIAEGAPAHCAHEWISMAVRKIAFEFQCHKCGLHEELPWLAQYSGHGFIDIMRMAVDSLGGKFYGVEDIVDGKSVIRKYLIQRSRHGGWTLVKDPLDTTEEF